MTDSEINHSNPTIYGDTTMADVKNAIDKTEDLARKIWLAGLGAYGHGLNNLQDGYDKMNDQTRHFFDGLVEQGTKIEAEAKSTIDKTGEKIKEQGQKLKEQGEKLKEQGKTLRKEGINLNVSARVEEIREKVASKLTMPSFSTSSNDEKLEELNAKLEGLIDVVSKLAATEEAVKPAPKKKTTARKPAAKKEQAAA
jgi:Poly(hydroxyalcanoate) granule associated protein (phasin)